MMTVSDFFFLSTVFKRNKKAIFYLVVINIESTCSDEIVNVDDGIENGCIASGDFN